MSHTLQEKVFSGFFWQFFERFGNACVGIVISILLARLLEPEAYGTVALLQVFINFFSPFVHCGMGIALVRGRHTDDLDFSTFFLFNLLVGFLIYSLLFFASPVIAEFYRKPEITLFLRIQSLSLIVGGFKSIQVNYVARNMLFRKSFTASLIGTVVSGVLGIFLAFHGAGAWALIGQSLSYVTVSAFVLWITVQWRPHLRFSFRRLKALWNFGWKILAVTILNSITSSFRAMMVGKVYSPKDLAFYDKGYLFPDVINSNLLTAFSEVLFPAFSKIQDDPRKLREALRRAGTISLFILAPLNFGLIACATPLVRLVLTEKWLPCVPFLIIFSLSNFFLTFNTMHECAVKARGRSDIFLKVETIKKVLDFVFLLLCWYIWGLLGIAASVFFVSFARWLMYTFVNRRLLNYSLREELKDMCPPIFLGFFMLAAVYPVQFLKLPDGLILLLQFLAGFVVYIGLAFLLKLRSLTQLWEVAVGFLRKRKEAAE